MKFIVQFFYKIELFQIHQTYYYLSLKELKKMDQLWKMPSPDASFCSKLSGLTDPSWPGLLSNSEHILNVVGWVRVLVALCPSASVPAGFTYLVDAAMPLFNLLLSNGITAFLEEQWDCSQPPVRQLNSSSFSVCRSKKGSRLQVKGPFAGAGSISPS